MAAWWVAVAGCHGVLAPASRTDHTVVLQDTLEADTTSGGLPNVFGITVVRRDSTLQLSFWVANPPGPMGVSWLPDLDLDTDANPDTPEGTGWAFLDGTRIGPDFRALAAGPGAWEAGEQGRWAVEHTHQGDWLPLASRVAPGRHYLVTLPRSAVGDTGGSWPYVFALYEGPAPGWAFARAWVGTVDGGPARLIHPFHDGPGALLARSNGNARFQRPLLPGEALRSRVAGTRASLAINAP